MMRLALTAFLVATATTVQSADYTPIVGFEPLTDVRDQLRIDLDQQKINELLEQLSDDGFAAAKKMYEEGAFSKTVSDLTLNEALTVDIPKGTRMMGVSPSTAITAATANALDPGSPVQVYAVEAGSVGDTSLRVQYVNEGCYVGANPDPITFGCLSPSGDLVTEEDTPTTMGYTYDVLTDTKNVYSIQLFTKSSEFKFENDPLTRDFQKFVDYFGSESYADDIIQAALAGTSTSFSTGKNLDMSSYGHVARAEIVSKASAYMAVWMYVLREMEHAIYLCETGDCDENSCFGKPAVHEVDEAVAFYAGSLEGAEGSSDGVLTYRLAEKRAEDFKTKGPNGNSLEGTAKANLDLWKVFDQASEDIVAAKCEATREDTTRIVQLMQIPLVQGTLRYAYKQGVLDDKSEKTNAEGAIFAASVLPFVHTCNQVDAETIYQNTKTGATSTDYAAVRQAFENNYECLGITSADVGGLWDVDNEQYYEGAAPVGVAQAGEGDTSDAPTMAVSAGVAMLTILALFI